MNINTFYNDLKNYLDANTILVSNGFKIYYSTTKAPDKTILLNMNKHFASDENSMHSIDLVIYGTSNDYENLHSVMNDIRDNLHFTRSFLSSFKASYCFCGGIMDDVVLQSVEGVNDRAVHCFFEATIRVQE